MGKVNVGLRGWRFDEDAVFEEDGTVKPIGAMDPETRERILCLAERMTDPCDACWLVHGEEDVELCEPAAVIYGEPRGEVILCRDHERDFVYWFREVADEELVGTTDLADAFHEWFVDGGRAPESFEGLEHVDRSPEAVPDEPDHAEAMPGLSEELDQLDDEDLDALDVDLEDLDV